MVIRAEAVTFAYRRSRPVLRDVSCDVRTGEVLALAGPNGSGKSTLVALLAGLLVPDRGEVFLADRSIATIARRDVARLIGYVAQSADLHFPFTVLEYVLQGRFAHGHLLGFESEADVRAAEHALEMTSATELVARRIDELSGGERQRMMLARALAQEPRVLLLDEPTSNLDIAHQVRLLDLVRRLAHERQIAVVVVSHDLSLAAEFADRMIMLSDGTVRGSGPPADVLRPDLIESVFGAPVVIDANPVSGTPRVTVVASPEKWAARDERTVGDTRARP